MEGLKENGKRKGCGTRLHVNTLSCAPEIARDILRMERGREERGELGGEKAVYSQNHAYIHFSLHVRQNHVYSLRLWHVHQNHAYSHLSFELCLSPASSRSGCCAQEKVIQERVDLDSYAAPMEAPIGGHLCWQQVEINVILDNMPQKVGIMNVISVNLPQTVGINVILANMQRKVDIGVILAGNSLFSSQFPSLLPSTLHTQDLSRAFGSA